MARRAPLSRRAFLRGTAGAAISLPFLQAMVGKAQTPVPKRLIVWFTPNGYHADSYPTSFDLTGTSLEPLAPFSDDIIVSRGISLVSAGGYDSAEHPTGFGHILTGDACSISGDDLRSANISIDQFVAKRMGNTRFATSAHGVECMRTMTWDRSEAGVAVPVRPDEDPRSAFSRLFSGLQVSTDDAAAARAAARETSILDTVRTSYSQLVCQLGTEDKLRLDTHLENIRAIESRLSAPPSCSEFPAQPPSLNYKTFANHQQAGRRHVELLVKALECDLTRVGTMQWYSHTGIYNEAYVWDGLESHHEASHADRHGAHDKVFAGELAYLLGLLRDAVAEDGQSLLHHTAVLCVSELGIHSGEHHLADHGIILAGAAGGALSPGQYIDFIGANRNNFEREPDWKRKDEPSAYFRSFDVPHNKLLVEIINAVSPPELEPVTTFGDASVSTGGLPQIRA